MPWRNMEMFDTKFLKVILEEVNSIIDVAQSLAMEDFKVITDVVRHVSNGSIEVSEGCEVGSLVTHLQYYDTFYQKSQHVKNIHCSILEDIASVHFKPFRTTSSPVNLLRLNQLQYQITNSEYVKTVSEIQRMLSTVNPDLVRKTFSHTKLVQSAAKIIDSKFSYAATLTGMWEAFCVHSKISVITRLYSMESERSVLAAYMQKPDIKLHEIQLHAEQINANNQNIELF